MIATESVLPVAAVGANCTSNVHDVPAARLEPQLFETMVKGAARPPMLLMVSAALPLLLKRRRASEGQKRYVKAWMCQQRSASPLAGPSG